MQALASPSILGESPLWHGGTLVFVDMLGGTVRHVDPETLVETTVYVAEADVPYVGAVVAATDGGLAVMTLDGVVRVDRSVTAQPIARIVDGTARRLNDAAVDPIGRLWVGSVPLDPRSGVGILHIWSPERGTEDVLEGMTLPNGIGWSPDGATVFVVDSGTRALLAAEFDTTTGATGSFRRRHVFTGSGEPDGLAVASDGSLWVAIWMARGSRDSHPTANSSNRSTFQSLVPPPSHSETESSS